jgi:hypothetical protein
MTTSKPIVLVIGIGPTLKIINTIKTIAHLILAQLETVFIVIQQLNFNFVLQKYHLAGCLYKDLLSLKPAGGKKILDRVDAQFSTLNRR